MAQRLAGISSISTCVDNWQRIGGNLSAVPSGTKTQETKCDSKDVQRIEIRNACIKKAFSKLQVDRVSPQNLAAETAAEQRNRSKCGLPCVVVGNRTNHFSANRRFHSVIQAFEFRMYK